MVALCKMLCLPPPVTCFNKSPPPPAPPLRRPPLNTSMPVPLRFFVLSLSLSLSSLDSQRDVTGSSLKKQSLKARVLMSLLPAGPNEIRGVEPLPSPNELALE